MIEISNNRFTTIYIAFLTLANLSTGSVYFLLLTIDGVDSTNFSSALYVALFFVQLVIIFLPNIIPQLPGLSGPVLPYLLLSGMTCILVLLTSIEAKYLACLVMGLTYGITLPAFAEYSLKRINKKTFYKIFGLGKIIGRSSSSISVMVAGTLISIGYTSSQLLFITGMLGIISTFILYVICGVQKKNSKIKPLS